MADNLRNRICLRVWASPHSANRVSAGDAVFPSQPTWPRTPVCFSGNAEQIAEVCRSLPGRPGNGTPCPAPGHPHREIASLPWMPRHEETWRVMAQIDQICFRCFFSDYLLFGPDGDTRVRVDLLSGSRQKLHDHVVHAAFVGKIGGEGGQCHVTTQETPRMTSIALGRGRGTAPFPGTPSPKTKPAVYTKELTHLCTGDDAGIGSLVINVPSGPVSLLSAEPDPIPRSGNNPNLCYTAMSVVRPAIAR